MMSDHPYYILIGKRVFKTNIEGYVKWDKRKPQRRTIALTHLSPNVGVSTVFLMIDHRYDVSKGKPIVFETMIFGGKYDGDCRRYSTYNKALDGHEEMVRLAREGIVKQDKN